MRARIRLGTVAALAAALLLTAPAAPAGAQAPGQQKQEDTPPLSLVVKQLTPMLPGQQGWIGTTWTTDADVCDVEITGSAPGLVFSYPTNTATFSSFYTASALATGNLDLVAFNITVDPSAKGSIAVALQANYRLLPPGQVKKEDDLKTKKIQCSGPKGADTITTTMLVSTFQGAKVVQQTPSVTVSKGQPAWVDVQFRGNGPGLGNFRVAVNPVTGMTVVYPGDGTSAGLAGGTALPIGRADTAAMRLDASGLDPGTYKVPLKATFDSGTFDSDLTVVVTP